MSRSFKKNPFVNDHKRKVTKHNKRMANRKIRRTMSFDLLSDRAFYKKATESYDITDYCWIWTKQDAIDSFYESKRSTYLNDMYPTLESWLNYWEKCVRRK